MSDNIIFKLLEPIHKLPHDISCMDKKDREIHLEKIRDYIKKTKISVEKISDYEKQKADLNILSGGFGVFGLAYYGLSVKSIIEDIVSIYKNIFGHYIEKVNSKYICSAPYGKPYKKILFFSSRMNCESSVYRSTIRILNHLSKAPDFHVDFMTKLPILEKCLEDFSSCKNIIKAEDDIHKNIEKIGAGRYDVIVYPDMNMDPLTSCIGLFRLAPHQINTFGHSESSGTADYFITSKYYEIEPEKNYTEKVVAFDSLALDYKKINIDDHFKNFKPREYFQIHKDSNIYYCNSSFFKMGKEMLEIFKKILDKDKKAVIVLTKINFGPYDFMYFSSVQKNLEIDYVDRIKFISRLSYEDNLNFLYLSDVFLESYPFGNMNSTLECFSMGLPVVSMPTKKINGRFTYGFYKKMGFEKEFCFDTIDDYVDKAISIANSKDKKLRSTILKESAVLFEEKKSSQDWEHFIRSLP